MSRRSSRAVPDRVLQELAQDLIADNRGWLVLEGWGTHPGHGLYLELLLLDTMAKELLQALVPDQGRGWAVLGGLLSDEVSEVILGHIDGQSVAPALKELSEQPNRQGVGIDRLLRLSLGP